LDAVMKKQSTHFVCIIYPGKHNGTMLITYEARTEQLEQNSSYGNKVVKETVSLTLGAPKVTYLVVSKFVFDIFVLGWNVMAQNFYHTVPQIFLCL